MLYRCLALIFITLFSIGVCLAQENNALDSIFIKNSNLVYKNPLQANKVASYLIENATSKKEKIEGLYLFSESNFIEGNFNTSIEQLYEAYLLSKETDAVTLKILILTSIANRCRIFGVYDKSNAYIEQADKLLQSLSSDNDKNMCKSKILLEQSYVDLQSKNYAKALEKLRLGYLSMKGIHNYYPVLTAKIQVAIGDIETTLTHYQKAEKYYENAFEILKRNGLENSTIAAKIYNALGTIAIEEGNFEIADTQLSKSQDFLLIDIYTKSSIYKNKSEVYKAKNDIEKQQSYYQQYRALTEEIVSSERQSRNTIIKEIEKEEAYSLANEKQSYNYIFILLLCVLIISFIIYYYYNKKLNREYQHFEALLEKIEHEKTIKAVSEKDYSIEVKLQKGLNIPDKTEQYILEQLDEFEASTFYTNPSMTLQLLAKKLKTNTKYLSEVIHIHKNKNFNNYINELRINYIINLMTTDKKYLDYKVSYLAETCGYSSHSAFSAVFKSITELTPKQFVTFLKKKNEKQ
jgi:AraC-like DNA-binding protein